MTSKPRKAPPAPPETYEMPMPPAFWDAGVTVQQELVASGLRQAHIALQQRLTDKGKRPKGTPRIRLTIETDAEDTP